MLKYEILKVVKPFLSYYRPHYSLMGEQNYELWRFLSLVFHQSRRICGQSGIESLWSENGNNLSWGGGREDKKKIKKKVNETPTPTPYTYTYTYTYRGAPTRLVLRRVNTTRVGGGYYIIIVIIYHLRGEIQSYTPSGAEYY